MPHPTAILERTAADGRNAGKRVLVYSHDTFGLGNIRRMLEISRHLVESDPQLSVLIITGSPMLHAFRIPPRIDYVKLPCLARTVQGNYQSKYLDLSADESTRLRANLIRTAMLDFQPDLILVDKKPFGVRDELAGALASLGSQAKRPKLVLLLRDILDSPEATTPVWRKNRYYEAIGAYYDDVLVVGAPEIFDLRTEYAFPPMAAAKITFCGYIARSAGCQSCTDVRREIGVACDERLVLVTSGGGEDGYALQKNYLEAQSKLPESIAPRSLVVCGPEMKEEQRAEIVAAAQSCPKVTVCAFSDDMMSLMNAADLVVCMGGYNTVCEVLTLRKRAIVVPRVEPVQEQWIRAQRMSELGLLRAIHPADLTPQTLAAALQSELETLNQPRPQLRLLDMGGLENVASAIRGHLYETRRQFFPINPPKGEQPWQLISAVSASW